MNRARARAYEPEPEPVTEKSERWLFYLPLKHMDLKSEINTVISNRLNQLGITQMDLCKQTGWSPQYIGQLLNNESQKRWNLEALEDVLNYLGIEITFKVEQVEQWLKERKSTTTAHIKTATASRSQRKNGSSTYTGAMPN